MRGHLRTLLGSDAAAPLVDELTAHAPDPRPGQQRRAAERNDHRQKHVAQTLDRRPGAEEDSHSCQDQHRTDREPRGGQRCPQGLEVPPAPFAVTARPEDRETDGTEHHWPREVPLEPEAGEPEERKDPDDDEADRDGPARRRQPDPPRWRLDPVSQGLEWGEQPGQDVDDEPEAGGEGADNERDPHDARLHAKVVADPTGDAGDPSVAAAALEAGSPLTGVDLGHGRMFPQDHRRPRWGTTPRSHGADSGSDGGLPQWSSAPWRPIIRA